MKCLSKNKASLIYLVILNVLCLSRHVWQFHQSLSGVVIWRSRSRTPSFIALLYGRYANFLKATWFAYGMEISLSLEASSVCSFIAEQYYKSCDLDDATERISQKGVFLVSDPGLMLQISVI